MTVNTTEFQRVLRIARMLVDIPLTIDEVIANSLIPEDLRAMVRQELEQDRNFQLVPPRMLVADPNRPDWLGSLDRSSWQYWPTLRSFLSRVKGWNPAAVRQLDDASDRILRQLAHPDTERFDIRGLVLGLVQSGKTANYTALMAKAADAGYRLFVVLSGIDNGLRRQTNIRLKQELIGYPDNRPNAVPMPPRGSQWHEFTVAEMDGDFRPGYANHAALQGSQPVLLVVKKNGTVLRRLLRWLEEAPPDVKQNLPVLIIDDEADQASVDTRGTYQSDDDPLPPDYEPPSIINGLIRDLLNGFERRAYVAYTATPFANILIPHDTSDPRVGNDLYPKDFIVDLPKPSGYFGAEDIFGRMDYGTGVQVGGLDVIREVPDDDIAALSNQQLPNSLETAIMDFVLAGSARVQRSSPATPATMLIHTSQRIFQHSHLRALVEEKFGELRDEWRYQRRHGIAERLKSRWDEEFRTLTRQLHPERDVAFEAIEPFVGPFFEAVQVREVNSATGDVLDYEREPSLKAIAVGGNRLSRGLTLEGLIVSYFIRPSATYDTLMQMGRWFGFRSGYEDLTRIWTPVMLSGWFSDLAFVEHRLREDIAIYENQGLTPYQVGMRIWQHPTMQVTSAIKRRFASNTVIASSYAGSLEQTFKFPLRRLDDLGAISDANLSLVRDLSRKLGVPTERIDRKGPLWKDVSFTSILDFLRAFRIDNETRSISLPLIVAYIERLAGEGELIRWIVAMRGLQEIDPALKQADWHLPTGPINQISRSRLSHTDSLGVIVDPEDEALGLQTEKRGNEARAERSPEEGLLLLYPISRWSGANLRGGSSRQKIFDDPDGQAARDLIALALSFPHSNQPQHVEAYLEGTVGWRPTP